MKKIFAIDWIMIITFVPSICSGIGLHIAGHGTDHEVWHNWAVLHVFSSLLFLVAAIFHIKTHWSLYRSSVRSGMGHKSPVTAVLSVVFVFVVVTGVVLLGIEGGDLPLQLPQPPGVRQAGLISRVVKELPLCDHRPGLEQPALLLGAVFF